MARVTLETVDQMARLARVRLTDDERTLFRAQVEQILQHAESLPAPVPGEVGAGVPATPHRLREDVPRPSLPRDEALAEAPDAADGLLRVPRVLGR